MKPWIKLVALLLGLCLMMGLCACSTEPDEETTVPTETTAAPTEPDPLALYEEACESLSGKSNLVVSFNCKQQKSVGGENYQETSVGTASYTGLGTENMQALVSEALTLGTYETQYIRSYLSGSGYCRANNNSYVCAMTAEEFLAEQIPAALLTEMLYGHITAEANSDGTLISFADPLALESWAVSEAAAQLTAAYGTATLDAAGILTAATYHAEYTLSNVSYILDVAITVSTPVKLDFSTSQPVYPENCVQVNDLSIPRKLLQTVGNVYSTQSMSVSYSDRLSSEVFVIVRSQNGSFNTYGSGDDFLCTMDTQVALTDYSGVTATNSQSVSYAEGLYSYSTNGGEIQTAEDVTAEQVRTACEDSILASLIELDCFASAKLTDTGDFLRIDFVGNDTFTEAMCDSIYAILGMDLDTYAESYSTSSTGGYLVLNRYTGLPTSLGMYLSRSHVIDGVSFKLDYQMDQAMDMASNTAYENITGQIEPEEEPAEAAQPLFYRVTDAEGHEMWLLGTIHVGDERTGSLPDEIMDAFEAADALAVEFDTFAFQEAFLTDTSLQSQVLAAYYYSDGSATSKHLSADVYSQLSQLILASGANSYKPTYMKVSIWNSQIESFYLQEGSDLSSSKAVDLRLLRLAKAQEKPIYQIESGLSQFRMLSDFSENLQAMLLQDTMELGVTGYCAQVEELYGLWCQGDEEALTAYLTLDQSSITDTEKALYTEYNNAVITSRNKTMHTAAVNYLQSGETVFYAVGVAHLLGEDGLLASLRAAGCTVELVTYE